MAFRSNYTFLEFFNIFKDKVNESSPNAPTNWLEGSTARAVGHAISFLAETLQLNINIAFQSFKIKTAKGIHLDRRVGDWGIIRKESIKATAVITFTLSSGRTNDIIYPAGLVFRTPTDIFGNYKSYELINDVTALIADTTVTGTVIAIQDGSLGNTPINTITISESTLTGVDSVSNLEAVGSGADRETDEQLRARTITYINGFKGIGSQSSIEAQAYSVEGIILAKAIKDTNVNGNFTLYVTNREGVVDSQLTNDVITAVEQVVAFPITFNVIAPIPTYITIEFDGLLDVTTYNQNALVLKIQDTLKSFINNIRRNEIYIADIISNVKSIDGVINIKNVKINGLTADLELTELETAKINNIADITINLI